MKKFLTLAAAAGMAFSAANAAPAQKLKLVGNQLSTEDGAPIQLKGFSTFSIHFNDGTACLSNKHFDAMKAWNCNVVRFAMYVDDTNDGGAYISNPNKYKAAIKDYVETCLAKDMYAVVDWHILETSNNTKHPAGNPNTYKSDAIDFFKDFAKWVVDNGYEGKVMYELCNEPTSGWSSIKSYAEDVIEEIVKIDKGALCIVGTDSWCQKILDPVSNPIKKDYQSNVLYSFHYYAASHAHLLGDLKNACGSQPCIVSEWSTVTFNGDGAHDEANSQQLMAVCNGQNQGKQILSWFFWNWGKKNEGSTVFAGDCSNPGNGSVLSTPGNYIVGILNGGEVPPIPEPEGWGNPNIIPSKVTAPFDWLNYDLGGEGIAYHDGDGDAYEKDADGAFLGYTSGKEEADALSQARNREKADGTKMGMNPNFTYKSGSSYPVAWKEEQCIDMDWTKGGCQKNGFIGLNSGLKYNMAINYYPDEKLYIANSTEPELIPNGRAYGGVDISKCSASLVGSNSIDAEIAPYGFANICMVEAGEWISYTVDVQKAGYYKIHYLASGQNEANSISISLNGVGGGNIIRDFDEKDDISFLAELYTKKAPTIGATNYDDWTWQQFTDEDGGKEVGVVFAKKGLQSITITFNGQNGSTGPLYFVLDSEDVSAEIEAQKNRGTGVSTVAADAQLVIAPNPTSGEFVVSLGTAEAAQVSVVNIAGQTVYSEAVAGQDEVTISKKLASGIYTVVVASESGVRTAKLQVK